MTNGYWLKSSSADSLVLLLGVGTMLTALLAGTLAETYEGPSLVGDDTYLCLSLSLLLLTATIIAFAMRVQNGLVRPRTIAGFVLALAAIPVTFLLAAGAVLLLNALGVYW